MSIVAEIFHNLSSGFRPGNGVVTPAKAGVQALNGIARVARDSENLIAGGSASAPWVTFFASAKKFTKESTFPGRREYPLRFAPRARRSPDGTSLSRRATRAIPRAPLRALRPRLAMLGRAMRGEKEHPCQGSRWVAHLPVARAEYRSPSGGMQASPVFESSRVVCGRRVGERPLGRGTQGVSARSRASFSLVTFSWTSTRKSPAVGQPPTSARGRRPLDILVGVRN